MSSLRIGIMKPGSASFLRITSPIANSFLTTGLPVCAVKTNNLLDGFMAEPRINFIPGIRAPALAPAIDPHAVTRYRQFWGHLGRRVQYPPSGCLIQPRPREVIYVRRANIGAALHRRFKEVLDRFFESANPGPGGASVEGGAPGGVPTPDRPRCSMRQFVGRLCRP